MFMFSELGFLHLKTAAGLVGRVEAKLVSLRRIRGVVCGNWGKVSEHKNALFSIMATSRVSGVPFHRQEGEAEVRGAGEVCHDGVPQEDPGGGDGQGAVLVFAGQGGVTWPWLKCCSLPQEGSSRAGETVETAAGCP